MIMIQPLIFNFGPWEIIIIALVVLLLLGGRKIPELMKGLGEGIKNFKSGLKDADGKEDKGKEESSDKA